MSELLEELEIISATKSSHGYLASQLSDNIFEKDDGTLIVVGCPIARTGWQRYSVKDLPQERAADLGVDTSNPEASIDLYRPEDEVFHPEFLASLNGVTITDGHPPNGDFVDTKNFNKYSQGHIQNVRRGSTSLEDGEWPIIADLHISAEPLISKVRNKIAREISLGYDFSIKKVGNKICQAGMIGNHNAVVPKGRAGDLIRIEDAMPDDLVASVAQPPAADGTPKSFAKAMELIDTILPKEIAPTAPPVEVIEAAPVYPPIKLSLNLNKEKQPVSATQKLLRLLGGKHLIEMARATDADPEKIMETALAFADKPATVRAVDEAEPPKDTQKNEFKSDDKKSKDEDKEEKKEEKKDGEDAKAGDRKRMHDALDAAFDARGKGKDSDVKALKTLLDEFLTEEEKEPEHEAGDTSEIESAISGGEDCANCGKAHDTEECPDEFETESGEEEIGDEEEDRYEGDEGVPDNVHVPEKDLVSERNIVADRKRAADSAMAVLSVMRPFAARSTDAKFKATFNRALDSVKKSSRASTGGYGKFAGAARARDKAPRNPNPERKRAGDASGVPDQIATLQQFYDNARKGGK